MVNHIERVFNKDHGDVSEEVRTVVKTVTFSFKSSEYDGTEATETFTFEELEIDKKIDGELLERELEQIFQAWVWHKLNISCSIIMDKSDTAQ
ncbi:hypothetical protein HMPREF9372_2768 [Sporosarcina newyorkensis 2681]|uniref:Uncharacterized protein n=1 Tax=Sporosarcina newyorkensis 2681 TaxID=1027292 RepID=F9DVD7_9BACL|nr:hypothetical protein HMPREF9372_2768 [Sporosarcina newyorkensis 2681]